MKEVEFAAIFHLDQHDLSDMAQDEIRVTLRPYPTGHVLVIHAGLRTRLISRFVLGDFEIVFRTHLTAIWGSDNPGALQVLQYLHECRNPDFLRCSWGRAWVTVKSFPFRSMPLRATMASSAFISDFI